MQDNNALAFGDLLKHFRKRQKITQQDLASRLGIHRNTIGTWEHGDFLPESKTIVLELARQLQLDTYDTGRLLEASLTAVATYWSVPYMRNPFFTGREEVLQTLHDAFHYEQNAILSQSYTLSGLGGIGKTQIAIEYAYRHANDYSAVFWICVETYEALISSMANIADVLNLNEKQEQDQHRAVAAVTRWLTTHKSWLLLFDSVEDPDLVKSVLPAIRHGHMLFTSRRQALGFGVQMLKVEPMTPEEGMILLLRRAGLPGPAASLEQADTANITAARSLVELMGGLPLALDQAGAYIEATQCNLDNYLQHFRFSQFRLLDDRASSAEHPLSVAKTFLLAFERVQQNNTLAADILTACAFLASEGIPVTFFTEGLARLDPAFASLATDPLQFDAAIKELLIYSLLRRDATSQTLTIHRLVQVVLKESLSPAAQQTWSGRVIRALVLLFPSRKSQSHYWQTCEQLLPHALVCLALNEQMREYATERITLLNQVASYLQKRARYSEAETLFAQALHIAEHELDAQHPLVKG